MSFDTWLTQGGAPRRALKRGAAARGLVALVLVCAWPLTAHAEPASPNGALLARFASHVGVLVLTAAVVLVAFLVNRFAPKKREHIRRAVIPLLLYMISLVAAVALPAAGAHGAADIARALSEVLGVITAINVVAIALFNLVLPTIQVELSPLVTDIAMGAAYIVAILAGMRRWGVELSGVIATSAVVTAILALSLQATLGNILGGVALQLDNSIRVGDWVQLENGKQGRVREIRWRHTVLETRDWDTLIVPNASLLAATIMILGKREGEPLQRRMWVYFNVDFRYSPADVISAVERALRTGPIEGVAASPPPQCVCLDFAREGRDSFAHYALRYWLTDLARDDTVNSSVRARIYSALKRANIPLAVPAAHLWIEQDSGERRERKHRRDLAKRVDALHAVGFLRPLTEDELSNIAEDLRYAPFAAGETITKQGAVAHWLYLLTEGVVEVRVGVEGGPDRAVTKLEAPNFIGEMGLMTGEPRAATVVALTDVECYRLDKEVFRRILNERPEIASEISALLAERRVALEAVLDGEGGAIRRTRLDMEQNRLLGTIRGFFGLGGKDDGQG